MFIMIILKEIAAEAGVSMTTVSNVPTHSGEAFTGDYDLPNDTNYSETCASIGLIFFAQKSFRRKQMECTEM
jgi:DUF1680 family protein